MLITGWPRVGRCAVVHRRLEKRPAVVGHCHGPLFVDYIFQFVTAKPVPCCLNPRCRCRNVAVTIHDNSRPRKSQALVPGGIRPRPDDGDSHPGCRRYSACKYQQRAGDLLELDLLRGTWSEPDGVRRGPWGGQRRLRPAWAWEDAVSGPNSGPILSSNALASRFTQVSGSGSGSPRAACSIMAG